MKYTVTINKHEHAEGVFDTYEEAEKYLVELLKADEWISTLLQGNESDEEIIDLDNEGYYRIMQIVELEDEDNE